MRILANANKAVLFGFVTALIFANVIAQHIGSENVVGYCRERIGKGLTSLALPSPVNGISHEVLIGTLLSDKDVCCGAILDGDRVAVLVGNNEVWATIIETEDGDLKACSDFGEPLDNCALPSVNRVSYLKVWRDSDCETFITIVGGYDILAPIHCDDRVADIPLSKIPIERGIADEVPRFDVVMKDGSRTTSRIRKSDRLIVDIENGKPLDVNISEIAGFDRPSNLSPDKRQEIRSEDIVNASRAFRYSVSRYDGTRKLRDYIIGAAWDRNHPIASLCWWIVGFVLVRVVGKLVDAALKAFWQAAFVRELRMRLTESARIVSWWFRRII